MSQQQFFKVEERHETCDWLKLEKNFVPVKEKEEMVKIPVVGIIDSATGKITFNKNYAKV